MPGHLPKRLKNQKASKCSVGRLVVVVIMLRGLIVCPPTLASAVVGMFDQAEKMKAAAQATIRTVRIGGLLSVV